MTGELHWISISIDVTRQTLRDNYSVKLVTLAHRHGYRLATIAGLEQDPIPCLIPGNSSLPPRPRIDPDRGLFPVDHQTLSRTLHLEAGPANRTQFLAEVDLELLGYTTIADEVRKQYEILRGMYYPEKDRTAGVDALLPGGLGDLSVLKAEAQRQLSCQAGRVANTMGTMALPILLVLFWETYRANDTAPSDSWDSLPNETRRQLTQVELFFL